MLQRKKQINARNSSIELLRIIAMIMIVFHHFAMHGGFEWEASSVPLTRFWYNFIIMGGKIGVDVFVIISGYYLINNNSGCINLNKVVKFVGQVFFYSVVIYLVSALTGLHHTGIESAIRALLPITSSQWWFASTYFVLFLLHPFINKLLHCIDKSLYQKLLFILVVFWSVIPTFTPSSFQGNSLLWFITLYSIAGYIRLYGLNNKFTLRHYCVFGLSCSLLTYTSSVVFTVLGKKWGIFTTYVIYFYGEEKLTTLLIAINLFMVFATLKMNYNKWINIVASATFGVYLIHDNNIIRPFLWLDVFHNSQYQESILLIPYSILVVTIVYIVCTLIELVRLRVIEKPFMVIVNRYSEQMIRPFKMVINAFSDFIFGIQN